jgi:peptidoglycan-N-acetylglucosamine deacetylase
VHGHAHLRHPQHERAVIEADLVHALGALAEHGVRPSLWRLPYGEEVGFSAGIAARHGLRIVRWTADSYDWRGERAGDMLAALQGELRDGAVLLMHDGGGNAAETAALIEPLVEAIRANGLEPGRIDM